MKDLFVDEHYIKHFKSIVKGTSLCSSHSDLWALCKEVARLKRDNLDSFDCSWKKPMVYKQLYLINQGVLTWGKKGWLRRKILTEMNKHKIEMYALLNTDGIICYNLKFDFYEYLAGEREEREVKYTFFMSDTEIHILYSLI